MSSFGAYLFYHFFFKFTCRPGIEIRWELIIESTNFTSIPPPFHPTNDIQELVR